MEQKLKMHEYGPIIDDTLDRAIDEETGMVLDEEALALFEQLSLDFEKKVEWMALSEKDDVAMAKAIREEAAKLTARAKALENKAEWKKNYLGYVLAGKKYESPVVSVSFRNTTSVDVAEGTEDVLSDEFLRIKKEVNKTVVKEALKEGVIIPGCQLVEKRSVIIK